MIELITEAGNAAGIYVRSVAVVGRGGPADPLQMVAHFAVGERAFLEPPDLAAIRRRREEAALLELALDPTAEELRAEFDAGPLGEA